jgi:hypothetical protein
MSTRLIKKLRLVVLLHAAVKAIKLYKRRGMVFNILHKSRIPNLADKNDIRNEYNPIEWSHHFDSPPNCHLSFYRNSRPQYNIRISHALALRGAL